MEVLHRLDMPYSVNQDRHLYRLKACDKQRFLHKLLAGHLSHSKCLPPDFISYPTSFLDGVLAGVLDGDGSISGQYRHHAQIKLTSDLLIRQLDWILRSRGVISGSLKPFRYHHPSSFRSSLPMFGLTFPLKN